VPPTVGAPAGLAAPKRATIALGRWGHPTHREAGIGDSFARSSDNLRREPDLIVADNQPYFVSDETDYTVPHHAERRGGGLIARI
jgi:hypothetical protein